MTEDPRGVARKFALEHHSAIVTELLEFQETHVTLEGGKFEHLFRLCEVYNKTSPFHAARDLVWAEALKRLAKFNSEEAQKQLTLQRYSRLRSMVSARRSDGGHPYFVFPSSRQLPCVGDPMKGSVAQHLDKALDTLEAAETSAFYASLSLKLSPDVVNTLERCATLQDLTLDELVTEILKEHLREQ